MTFTKQNPVVFSVWSIGKMERDMEMEMQIIDKNTMA